ncbi:MAG TPA: hypothetical protein VMW19_12115 [Myxococcota bacterium]|nr:hypothetical protein [Myxococcota bacterium]
MGRLRLALACALLSTSSGCSVALLGASFEPPRAAPVSVSRVAWLAPVQVTDAQIADRNDLERTLAPLIATYTQDAKYFPRVNLLPGHPADGDVVLHFEFDQYQLQRQPHPAALPFFLFGLYGPYWAFGGPVDRDVAMLSGGLRIEDSAGNALADSRGHFEDTHDVSVYSMDHEFGNSMKARTDLVRALLDDAVGQLARTGATGAPTPGSGA